jgi:hypothetical protein
LEKENLGMAMVEEGSTHPRGEALLKELIWIHGIIRENLKTIREVTSQVAGGAAADQVRAQIDDLSATSVVWRLRVDCMRYCHLVHSHHNLEDIAFFPFLCSANPVLQQVTEKLRADHEIVSDYLDKVEATAGRIAKDESARGELVEALNGLSDHLIAHLDYEEESLAPTLRRLTEVPFG